MDVHAALARLNADPALANEIAGELQGLIDQARAQAARREAELHAARTRIQALTLELAQLRRLRFGVRSEALSAEQRELFEETIGADLAAAEAQLESASPGRKAAPQHLGRPGKGRSIGDRGRMLVFAKVKAIAGSVASTAREPLLGVLARPVHMTEP